MPQCLHPTVIERELLMPSGVLENRKITVRCGKCEACLLDRQMMWRIRLNEEFAACDSAIFFTLTYDDEHLPYHPEFDETILSAPITAEEIKQFSLPSKSRLRTYRLRRMYSRPVVRAFSDSFCDTHYITFRRDCDVIPGDPAVFGANSVNFLSVRGLTGLFHPISYNSVVCKRDVQLFLKRLRKRLAPFRLRYFICSEYGPETSRPHYHGIIFNYPVNKALPKEKLLSEVESLLEATWQNGFVRADLCNGPRCNYCAKYCVKPSDALSVQRVPPFILCSRRPAIGAAYLERYDRVDWHIQQHSTEYVAPSFNKSNKPFKTKLPKYYVDRIFIDPSDRKVLSLYQRLKRLFGDDLEFADIFDIDDIRYIEEEQRQSTEEYLNFLEDTDKFFKEQAAKEEAVHRLTKKSHKGGKRSKNV